ncbi:MAG: type II secretion system F family protein, partial [Acidimicrobiales bacterium]
MFDFVNSVPIEMLVGLVGVVVGLVLWTVLSQVDEQAAMRDSLRALDDYEVEDVREAELLVPLKDRVTGPIFSALRLAGSRFNPPEFVEGVRKKHLQAGITNPDTVERFLALRILGFVMIPIWLLVNVVWNPMNFEGLSLWAVLGLGGLIFGIGPASSLNKKVEARQLEIRRSLPDVMDLLVISVEAGLGFEQALDRVINNVPGELSDEFARVLGETRAGSTRSDALRAMDIRCDTPEVRSFVLAMIQADTFGVSIGRVLRAQADELRIKRRQRAQEQAQKAPVKMMIPMVFCI